MDKVEIYEWLKSQKYQTGYDEVGEYVMYYSVDMPRILEDYYEYKVKKLNKPVVMHWVATSEQLPEFGVTVLVYCKIYGKFLATYEYIGEFAGEKYGNWRDFNGNLGILPPVYWMEIPKPPCA